MDVKPNKIPFPFKKLNKELIDNIVKDIEEGSTHKYASQANNITESIFNIWRKQGEMDIAFENDSLCAYLVVSLAKIKQKEIKKCRKMIKDAKKGHKGAEWTLEHAYWREYGSNAPVRELAEEIEALRETLKKKDKYHGETNDETTE